MSIQVSSLNGVKTYNLSSGKTLPEWLSEKKKKSLRKDEEFKRRIELVQDLDFPVATQRIKESPNGNFLVATGTYKPQIKVYELGELALKLNRHVNCEIVQFEFLSEDFKKLVFLHADRTLEFHAGFGSYHKTRVPKAGRDMAYQTSTCDLIIGGSSSEVYRLNLEQGQFMSPFETQSDSVNAVKINPLHQLIGCACDNGTVECFDPRDKKRVGILDVGASLRAHNSSFGDCGEVTALDFDADGLTFAAGTQSGVVALFDLRHPRATIVRDHQYDLPIKSVGFHGPSRCVLSADPKSLKIWNRDTGKSFSTIEPEFLINDVCTVRDSGLVFLATESKRIQTFYIPALGNAPKWCSFLDNLTEELEEEKSSVVYDDFKFVTREELEQLGLTPLIGSSMLRAFMHGFFMNVKLYNKAKALTDPMSFETYKKQKVAKTIEEKRADRISVVKKTDKSKAPAVNRELAAAMRDQQGEGENTLLGDNRFSAMFENPDFKVDETSREFSLVKNTLKRQRDKKMTKVLEQFEKVKEDEGNEEQEEEEPEGRGSDGDSDMDISTKELRFRKQKKQKTEEKKPAGPQFFELKEDANFSLDLERKATTKKKIKGASKMTLEERLKAEAAADQSTAASQKGRGRRPDTEDEVKTTGDGKEITFMTGRSRGNKKGLDDKDRNTFYSEEKAKEAMERRGERRDVRGQLAFSKTNFGKPKGK